MANNNYKTESRHTKKARLALCEPKDKEAKGKGNSYHWVLKDELPEVITGYDPTYILQFGFPPEYDLTQHPIESPLYLDTKTPAGNEH